MNRAEHFLVKQFQTNVGMVTKTGRAALEIMWNEYTVLAEDQRCLHTGPFQVYVWLLNEVQRVEIDRAKMEAVRRCQAAMLAFTPICDKAGPVAAKGAAGGPVPVQTGGSTSSSSGGEMALAMVGGTLARTRKEEVAAESMSAAKARLLATFRR